MNSGQSICQMQTHLRRTSMGFLPRVLFLNPWDRWIGPNRYLAEMLHHAPELAQKAIVVFSEENNALDEYRAMGCQVFIQREAAQVRARFRGRNLLEMFGRNSVGVKPIIRLLRLVQPELVVSNTEQLLVGGMAARLAGVPHLQIFHALTFAYRLGNYPGLIQGYLRFLSFWSQRVVAVSETLKKALMEGSLSATKVVTIPNPVPIEELKMSPSGPLSQDLESRLQAREPILLSAGGFFPKKGQDQLIEALPAIKKKFPQVLCLFAGAVGASNGWEDTAGFFRKLKRRVAELHLDENVFFLGEVDYLPSLMKRAGIYVQTSWTESFGRAGAEALVCHTPVVAFEVGALREAVGPGAVLVKSGDIRKLTQAILDLLAHPHHREQLVLDGSKHVERLYDAQKVAPRFAQVLASTAAQKAGFY